MNTHGFVPITATIIAFLLTWGSTQARAQSKAPEITVLSVLVLAKKEAEKGENEFTRNQLRARVMHSIIGTGNEAKFPDYVAQVRSAQSARPDAPGDDDLRFNWNIAERGQAGVLTW